MKKLYKYLAVALCALVGAGSATAQNPDKLYLYSSHCVTSGDWTPYYITYADNENGVYRFKGVPLVQNEYFVLASETMTGWTVNNDGKRYEPVRDDEHKSVTFNYNDASNFDEGNDHCWRVGTTGIYNLEINFSAKNLAFTRSEENTGSYRIHGTICDGSNWQDLMMTHNVAENVWEYKGPITSGSFGVKICDNNGDQTGWVAGNANITEPDTEYDFKGDTNSSNSLSGNYTIKYDPTNEKITFVSFPISDKPYLGFDNGDGLGWQWGVTINETSTPYVYEVTKEFNAEAYFKVSTYSGTVVGDWNSFNDAAYGVNAEEGYNVETSAVNGIPMEVHKGYKGAWKVSEAGSYKITVDFRSEGKQYITVTKLASPISDKPYLGYDNSDDNGWQWGEAINETSTSYVYEVTKEFNAGAFFKVSTYSAGFDSGKWTDFNAAAYGVDANESAETSTVNGIPMEVHKGYEGAWRVSEAGSYKITVDFRNEDGKQYITVTKVSTFAINGTTAPLICGVDAGTGEAWNNKVAFTKVSDTEYTYSFTATKEDAYIGLYDSNNTKFVPGGLTLVDGKASTTSFTESNKEFQGNDSSNECKISGLTVGTEYVMTLKKVGDTVTLSIVAGEGGDEPTPGTETEVTSEMIAGMIPTLPGAMYQISTFEKKENSEGKEKVLYTVGYDGVGAVTNANYYWVKYEDESVYYKNGVLNVNIYVASDNPKRDDIEEDDDADWKLEDSTDKDYHDCRNFSDAYYRVYMQNTTVPDGYQVWEGRPSAAVPTVLSEGFEVAAAERTSIINPQYGKDKLNVVQRVARTIFVESNTTGIEDVISPETTDDAEAPVVFYNLQGMRVENPSNGIYIRVQGKTTTKVYIK